MFDPSSFLTLPVSRSSRLHEALTRRSGAFSQYPASCLNGRRIKLAMAGVALIGATIELDSPEILLEPIAGGRSARAQALADYGCLPFCKSWTVEGWLPHTPMRPYFLDFRYRRRLTSPHGNMIHQQALPTQPFSSNWRLPTRSHDAFASAIHPFIDAVLPMYGGQCRKAQLTSDCGSLGGDLGQIALGVAGLNGNQGMRYRPVADASTVPSRSSIRPDCIAGCPQSIAVTSRQKWIETPGQAVRATALEHAAYSDASALPVSRRSGSEKRSSIADRDRCARGEPAPSR